MPIDVLKTKEVYWVLKGKSKDGSVDELEIFDKKVSVSEIKDLIEQYRDAGYVRLWLVKVENREGKEVEVKKEWVKNFPKQKSGDSDLTEIVSSLNRTMMEFSRSMVEFSKSMVDLASNIAKVKESISEPKMTLEDVIAQVVWLEHMKRVLVQTIGAGEGAMSPTQLFQQLMEIVAIATSPESKMILKRMKEKLFGKKEVEKEEMKLPSEITPLKVPPEIREMIKKVQEKVMSELMPCPWCVEESQEQTTQSGEVK